MRLCDYWCAFCPTRDVREVGLRPAFVSHSSRAAPLTSCCVSNMCQTRESLQAHDCAAGWVLSAGNHCTPHEGRQLHLLRATPRQPQEQGALHILPTWLRILRNDTSTSTCASSGIDTRMWQQRVSALSPYRP